MVLRGPSLLLIACSGAPARKQASGLSLQAALWLGTLWFINRVFLAPWQCPRTAGVESKVASPAPERAPWHHLSHANGIGQAESR